jgi:hypothetical protein
MFMQKRKEWTSKRMARERNPAGKSLAGGVLRPRFALNRELRPQVGLCERQSGAGWIGQQVGGLAVPRRDRVAEAVATCLAGITDLGYNSLLAHEKRSKFRRDSARQTFHSRSR